MGGGASKKKYQSPNPVPNSPAASLSSSVVQTQGTPQASKESPALSVEELAAGKRTTKLCKMCGKQMSLESRATKCSACIKSGGGTLAGDDELRLAGDLALIDANHSGLEPPSLSRGDRERAVSKHSVASRNESRAGSKDSTPGRARAGSKSPSKEAPSQIVRRNLSGHFPDHAATVGEPLSRSHSLQSADGSPVVVTASSRPGLQRRKTVSGIEGEGLRMSSKSSTGERSPSKRRSSVELKAEATQKLIASYNQGKQFDPLYGFHVGDRVIQEGACDRAAKAKAALKQSDETAFAAIGTVVGPGAAPSSLTIEWDGNPTEYQLKVEKLEYLSKDQERIHRAAFKRLPLQREGLPSRTFMR